MKFCLLSSFVLLLFPPIIVLAPYTRWQRSVHARVDSTRVYFITIQFRGEVPFFVSLFDDIRLLNNSATQADYSAFMLHHSQAVLLEARIAALFVLVYLAFGKLVNFSFF